MKTKKIEFCDSHAICIVDNHYGIYVPQTFIEWYEKNIIWPDDKKIEEVLNDLKNPENEWYWDSWIYVEDNCKLLLDGKIYFINQIDGDLFAIPENEYHLIDWDKI
jgi:hypothetical protein